MGGLAVECQAISTAGGRMGANLAYAITVKQSFLRCSDSDAHIAQSDHRAGTYFASFAQLDMTIDRYLARCHQCFARTATVDHTHQLEQLVEFHKFGIEFEGFLLH